MKQNKKVIAEADKIEIKENDENPDFVMEFVLSYCDLVHEFPIVARLYSHPKYEELYFRSRWSAVVLRNGLNHINLSGLEFFYLGKKREIEFEIKTGLNDYRKLTMSLSWTVIDTESKKAIRSFNSFKYYDEDWNGSNSKTTLFIRLSSYNIELVPLIDAYEIYKQDIGHMSTCLIPTPVEEAKVKWFVTREKYFRRFPRGYIRNIKILEGEMNDGKLEVERTYEGKIKGNRYQYKVLTSSIPEVKEEEES